MKRLPVVLYSEWLTEPLHDLAQGLAEYDLDLVAVDDLAELKTRIRTGHRYVVLDARMSMVGYAQFSRDLRACVPQDSEANLGLTLFLLVDDGHANDIIALKNADIDEVLSLPLRPVELAMRLIANERRVQRQARIAIQRDQLESIRQAQDAELELVTHLQLQALPTEPVGGKLDYGWMSRPSAEVSGDSLGFFRINSHVVCFYLLDVCGHGIPSAVDSLILSREIKLLAHDLTRRLDAIEPHQQLTWLSPATLMQSLNEIYDLHSLQEHIRYATAVVGFVDHATGHGVLCRAGHPSPIVVRQDGTLDFISQGDPPIGLIDNTEYSNQRFKLNEGERLIIYSDGCIEAHNADMDMYGMNRFLDQLEQHKRRPQRAFFEGVYQDILAFTRNCDEYRDDLSILSFEVCAQPVSKPPCTMALNHTRDDLQNPRTDEAIDDFKRILLIDDSRTDAGVLKQFLTQHGYLVRAIPRAELAMDLIKRWKPDLLLSDWNLPGQSGLELLGQVHRELENPPHMVLMSGYFDRDAMLKALSEAADDFIQKPVKLDELLFRLDKGRIELSKRRILLDQNAQMQAHSEQIVEDIDRIKALKRSSLPSLEDYDSNLKLQGMLADNALRSGSHASAWWINDRHMAFFLLDQPDCSLLGMFKSFLIERELGQQAEPLLVFEPDARVRPADPSTVQALIEQLLHTNPSAHEEFSILYGVADRVTGLIRWQSTASRHHTDPAQCSHASEQTANHKVSFGDHGGSAPVQLGYRLAHPEDALALEFHWMPSSQLTKERIPANCVRALTEGLSRCQKPQPSLDALNLDESFRVMLFCGNEELVEVSEKLEAEFVQWSGLSDLAGSFRLMAVELGTNTMRHGVRLGSEAAMMLFFLRFNAPFEHQYLVVYTDAGKQVPRQSVQNSLDLVNTLDQIPIDLLPEGGFGLSLITSLPQQYEYLYMRQRNFHFTLWHAPS